jgi:hypothetical protein
MSATGGYGPFTLAAVNAESLAIDGNNVYWSTLSGSGSIAYTPLHGKSGSGTVTPLASGLNATFLAVDPTFVYYDNFKNVDGGIVGSVEKVPIAGGGVTPLVTTSNYTTGLAMDTSFVYYFDGNSLKKCPLPSCSGGPVVLAPNRISPGAIAVDSVAVYWVETETVLKVAK